MNQIIRNTLGETLDYTFAPGIDPEKKDGWLVVLGHGVTGDKGRPVIVDTANALNAAGFDTLRFSFAGNGDSDGDFRDATISKEAGDLAAVIDTASQTYPHIAYIGHSMGGAVGVVQASKDQRIRLLVSLAGMVDTKTFAQTEFGDAKPDQDCMWGDDSCPLSSKFMHDLCQTIGSVAPLAEAIRVPWLLIHGTADDVVSPKDSEQIKAIKGDAVALLPIPDAGHSFDGTTNKAELTAGIVDWLLARTAQA